MTKEEARDVFEQYLFEMDDVLDELYADVTTRVGKLDRSRSSLGTLEKYLDIVADDASSREIAVNRAARHLGEVFRMSVGGRWDIDLDNERSLHYGLPVVTGYSSSRISFCPIEIVRNYLNTGRSGLLDRAVESHLSHADLLP